MQDVKKEIVEELRKIVKELTGQDIVPILEHPKDEHHGDYSTNIAMALFGQVSKGEKVSKVSKGWSSSLDLAREIASKFKVQSFDKAQDKSSKLKVMVAAPGFINFWLSEKYLLDNVKAVLEEKEKFGSKKEDPNKKVVVEYSSPNIAKPFTVGHLRSTIIGDAIANLLQANGWKVFRDNHLGDWGTQFGKLIYAIKEMGKDEEGRLVDYELAIEKSKDPLRELVSLYVIFHNEAEKNPRLEEEGRKWFKKLENGDKEARRLWKKCVEWSLKEFGKIYDALGVEFTENNGVGYGESYFEDKMGGVINELEKKGLLKESEGARLVFFPKDKYPPLMIVKKDGTTLYATRDLATDKFRLNTYGEDVLIINEVGIEQSLYFKQIFEIEKMLGWVKDGQRIHLKHGHYRFKDEKMSTRKGSVIWLEEVLEEAKRRAYKLSSDASFNVKYEDSSLVKRKLETNKRNRFDHLMGEEEARETAKDVAIGAIKWNDLKRSSNQDIIFDWDEILNMQGDSGPYIQYTYVRTRSVLSKAKNNISFARSHLAKLEPEENSLLRAIHRFPEVVGEAAEQFAPNILCNYLFDLAQKFNLFYQKVSILHPVILSEAPLSGAKSKDPMGSAKDSSQASPDQNDNIREFRVALTAAVGRIIKNGLYLLGIQAPERM